MTSPADNASQFQQQVMSHTQKLLLKGAKRYQISLPTIDILFDLTGRAAGQAVFSCHYSAIRFNAILMMQNKDHCFQQTIPHEVAHILCRLHYGNSIKPHGQEWKRLMHFFNAKPDRCHDLNIQNSTQKHYRTISYQCACQTYELTLIRHNRILRGDRYDCPKCKQTLKQN